MASWISRRSQTFNLGYKDEDHSRNSKRVIFIFHLLDCQSVHIIKSNLNRVQIRGESSLIVEGICLCRLAYLHEDVEPKIVHHNMKSSNILLDHHWNPKISDVGLAKLHGPEWSISTSCELRNSGLVQTHNQLAYEHCLCFH